MLGGNELSREKIKRNYFTGFSAIFYGFTYCTIFSASAVVSAMELAQFRRNKMETA